MDEVVGKVPLIGPLVFPLARAAMRAVPGVGILVMLMVLSAEADPISKDGFCDIEWGCLNDFSDKFAVQPKTGEAGKPQVTSTASSSQAAAAPGGMDPGNRPRLTGKSRAKKLQSPAESPVWRKFENAGPGRKTSGTGRDKRYYEWDSAHGDIEVYDRRGNHLGSMEPTTGNMYKDPVPGRYITL